MIVLRVFRWAGTIVCNTILKKQAVKHPKLKPNCAKGVFSDNSICWGCEMDFGQMFEPAYSICCIVVEGHVR